MQSNEIQFNSIQFEEILIVDCFRSSQNETINRFAKWARFSPAKAMRAAKNQNTIEAF